ncbi:hypothetical protein GCM10009577_37450 [Streptomyces javensis]
MPRLLSTVYVKDPETHEWAICAAGTEPEPRLAALIRTPSAWEDGEPPEPVQDPAAQEPAPKELADPEPKPDNKTRSRRTTKADE